MPTAGRTPLDVTELRERILASVPASRIDVVAETGSTNADLMGRAARGEDVVGAVLIAENQTAGRGRNGRVWSSVPGAQVIVSIAVDAADVPVGSWGWVPLVTGLAVVDAVREVTGVEAGLKWPNDVLAASDGRKLAGILAEVAPSPSTIVVGVGLNVSYDADELPDPNATSLTLQGAADVDRAGLIVELLGELVRRVDGLRSAGGADADLVAEYASRSLTVSARVRVTLPGDRTVVGMATGIDPQGRLHVDTETGVITISAGDVVHLRPV
ncbi:biotin--[acetyl-CoA-carboxylase] ligase [Mycolicibacterium sediminis]|uniref:biotin--[biotin carboxyl-carrier protein] ligase n=1 Tax=Mycolicibacterium sediminis TaxID=1286180 RepID=A0A7I7QQN1_9MYCO|nr:biotin--[acetyl-CoA-carboxylase] ligase [Mycolicibacterium sediminis]BBY28614.1 biotin--[acetyl-CoA-carboxylase] ligase [Mycolicibacterium sediminis]